MSRSVTVLCNNWFNTLSMCRSVGQLCLSCVFSMKLPIWWFYLKCWLKSALNRCGGFTVPKCNHALWIFMKQWHHHHHMHEYSWSCACPLIETHSAALRHRKSVQSDLDMYTWLISMASLHWECRSVSPYLNIGHILMKSRQEHVDHSHLKAMWS